MTSKKLRKYLAYYQKTLRDEPDNIEARLRLAAIFRDMGREGHAIDEYVVASKLLAREGLPLEAIAACKEVLRLAPDHSETQLFLARMYAHVPDAAGGAARIAQPVEADNAPSPSRRTSPESADGPITLDRPKLAGPGPSQAPRHGAAGGDAPTGASAAPAAGQRQTDEVDDEATRQARPGELAGLADDDQHRGQHPGETPGRGVQSAQYPGPQPTDADDHRRTTEMAPADRESVLSGMADDDEPTQKTSPAEVGQSGRPRRPTPPGAECRGADQPDQRPAGPTAVSSGEETFEIGVFEMESLGLDSESSGSWDDLSFLGHVDEPDTSELVADMADGSTSAEHVRIRRQDLPEIPLFSQLEPSVFMELLALMDYKSIPAGEPIVGPDRPGRSLYVVVRGQVVVTRSLDDGVTLELARIGEGQFFGEFELLTGRSQRATVRAADDLAVLEVGEDVVNVVADKHPEVWDVLWEFYHARMLNNLLASSVIFRSLDDAQRHELADKFSLRQVAGGDLLLGAGDDDEDLYLVCDGRVCVERAGSDGPAGQIDVLREGEFVGLISSAEEAPVVANLRAGCDTTLLVLPGQEFRRLLERNPAVARQVRQVVRQRKAVAGRYTSGVTSYAELGLAPRLDSTDSSNE